MIDDYYKYGGALAADPNNNLTYWSGGTQLSPNDKMLVSKTTNDGVSWSRYTLTSGTGFTASLAIDPSNSNNIYAGGYEGTSASLYKTTSGGSSWLSMSTGITGDTVHDIVIHPSSTNILYAGTSDGVFKSTNSGTNWINKGCSDVHALLVDPDQPEIVYAGTQSGVYKSTDNGDTWNVMNDGLNDTKITCLGICPFTYLFASTEESSMYRWSVLSYVEQEKEHYHRSPVYAYPNPSDGRVVITFALAHAAPVRISIYDIQGRLIATIVNGSQEPGAHQATWQGYDDSGNEVCAGVYFLEFKSGDVQSNKKLLVIK